MTRKMLDCPVSGCGRRRSSEHLMCRSDWWRVPKDMQDEVYRRWRAYFAAAPTGDPAAFRAAREAYQDIREQAIRAAEESRARSLAAARDLR